jgi:acyl-coenzyme A synthetase/AMP-(fatty) acid ligase
MIIRPPSRQGAAILDTMQLFCPDYCVIAPIVLADLVRALERSPRSINKMAVMRVAGAYCPPQLRQQALDLVTERLLISYGATEIGRVAAGYSDELASIDGAVGRVIDGVEVATFGDDGQRLASGTEGEIRVRVPDGTAATYPGSRAPQRPALVDGWFLTGDVGLVDADGTLIVRGRALNLINIGGMKLNAEMLEAVIAELDQIEEVGVVGAEGADGIQRLCAAVVGKAPIDAGRVNAHLSHNDHHVPVQILKIVPAIPKTANGKIDRAALRRLFDDVAG